MNPEGVRTFRAIASTLSATATLRQTPNMRLARSIRLAAKTFQGSCLGEIEFKLTQPWENLAIMSRLAPLILALTLGLSATAHANPVSLDPAAAPKGDYVLDKRHASLLVRIAHLGGFSRFTMRFDRIEGAFAFDPATWPMTVATIKVDPTSISTGMPAFDKTIAGPSYFNAAKYPDITFVAKRVDAQDGKGTISGDLTFHGVTRPVRLEATFNGFGPGMLGVGTRMGFSGTGHIKRSDYGVTTMLPFAGDDLELVFEVEFVKK